MSVYAFNLILRERGSRNLKCVLEDPFDYMLRSEEREKCVWVAVSVTAGRK